jgi:anti-sigma regulatory factor (Ser/Thr protein kinase)
VSQHHSAQDATGDGLDVPFDIHSLRALRSAVAAEAHKHSIHPTQLHALLIITSELASNAITHGGGNGRLRLWRHDRALHCQVLDNGPGMSDTAAGTRGPPDTTDRGRGLWIVRQLTTDLTFGQGLDDAGTVITATVPISPDTDARRSDS